MRSLWGSTTLLLCHLLGCTPGDGVRFSDEARDDSDSGQDLFSDAAVDSRHQERWFWRRRRTTAPQNPFDAETVSRLFAGLAVEADPGPCGKMLLATAVVNSSTWSDINDNTHNYFTLQEADSSSASVLFATGELWHGLETPLGSLHLVPGMQLVDVDGNSSDGWTWLELVEQVAGAVGQGDVQLGFKAGYDFRDCWGDTLDPEGNRVCGPEPFAALAEDLPNATANLTEQGVFEIADVRRFTVKTMAEEKVSLLRRVAPMLQADAEKRMREQQEICFRSALAPICVAVQQPVCKEGEGCQEAVFWVAQRRVELPHALPLPVNLTYSKMTDFSKTNERPVESLRLKGPRKVEKEDDVSAWCGKDAGFVKIFPKGMKLSSCAVREAALAMQFDSQILATMNMTDYTLVGGFYAQDNMAKCLCKLLPENYTWWPLILNFTQKKVTRRIAFGITDWLEQDQRKSAAYRDTFMQMWPHYFKSPEREISRKKDIIEAFEDEPAEKLEVGMEVRVMQKVKFYCGYFGGERFVNTLNHLFWWLTLTGCKIETEVDNKTTTLYYKQLDLSKSATTPGGSNYKVYPGDTGVIKALLRPERYGYETSTVVQFHKFQGRRSSPPPVFRMLPNQIMAVNRVVIGARRPVRPSPAPPDTTPTTTRLPKSTARGISGALWVLAGSLVFVLGM